MKADFRMHIENEMYQIILEEIAAYDFLYEALQKKQKAVVENRPDDLDAILESELRTVSKANLLTGARKKLLSEWFAEELHRAKSIMDIFLNHPFNREQTAWGELYRRLLNAVKKIIELNKQNKIVIGTALVMTKQMIRLLYPEDEALSKVYNLKGKQNKKVHGSNFINFNA
jgi:flagellar biosynthesis/type III secretory pathway chaperone